ncbi:hypothetical protein CesoFtcFv8_026264 [Champsocephalus esox]|uniref:Uncharacterized protein n=1 Tax=Champsocephalus esox TaxID=159716 RepID=A0AAN8G9W0_9TELE|nr:hypothetical protein CesoFtcFv8_026264 [Champsocephalus esox]
MVGVGVADVLLSITVPETLPYTFPSAAVSFSDSIGDTEEKKLRARLNADDFTPFNHDTNESTKKHDGDKKPPSGSSTFQVWHRPRLFVSSLLLRA